MLKRLTGLSRSALNKTRELLGAQPQPAAQAEASSAIAAEPASKPRKRGKARSGKHSGPLIVPAGEHSVTRKSIGRSALKVLDKLHEAGHSAYLVGGGVRDALVGLKPKDFDIATDASPETIRALFRNSRIIGRRFRLVHVVYGREIIEVATFRAAHSKGDGGEIGKAGRIVRDNVFGSIEEDAYRRDFSVNALYYNIADGSVVDYVGGLADLKAGVFKLIGEPVTRCKEDPVRVLRAVRLAAKLKFSIDEPTLAAMKQVRTELKSTPPPRLFEEVLKLFQGGYALRSFHSVREHDLLRYLFPMLDERLKAGDENLVSMLDAALTNTDRRVAQGKPITPAYLLAFMLWPDVQEQAGRDCEAGMRINDALFTAADSVLSTQLRVISIPRRFSGPMKEIWQMQPRLERLTGGRALKLMEDRRFRAAYDFLCLRSNVDERLKASAKWWTRVQTLSEEQRIDAAANRPVADGIWPDKRGQGARSAEDADEDLEIDGGTPGKSIEAAATSKDAAGNAAKKPPRKRRRRRRKPGGDKGSAGSSSPPAS
ncbi:polynucleotide adenylyltransferase PcnB [Granulosicoccus antarcticus]|uniref:polynucleotide adenylyltransferase PcnB n=1 Tax=Granulosicoccus antarcticus TaxID=437505 RepID=UPI0012FD1631|nr:polynucleotide adenylyltransferase PcnB [Granulosicoccus antarcticus]